MNINDIEITDCDSIGRYVAEIYRTQIMFYSKKFAKFNIGAGQYLFLLFLYRNDNITQEQLTDEVRVDKGTTARAIKKLEEEGYVIRTRKEDDKRSYNLKLTKKAHDIENEFFHVLNDWKELISKTITKEESDITLKVLKKIVLSDWFMKGEFEE